MRSTRTAIGNDECAIRAPRSWGYGCCSDSLAADGDSCTSDTDTGADTTFTKLDANAREKGESLPTTKCHDSPYSKWKIPSITLLVRHLLVFFGAFLAAGAVDDDAGTFVGGEKFRSGGAEDDGEAIHAGVDGTEFVEEVF